MSDLAPIERAMRAVLGLLCLCCIAVALIAVVYGDLLGALLFAVIAVVCWEAAALLDD